MNSKGIISILVVVVVIGLGVYFFSKDRTEEQTRNSDMLAGKGSYQVATSTVTYFENVQGFYAEPLAEREGADFPGVVMIHEWWGINDNIRAMAEELSKNGYRVIAVDLFGKTAETPEQARQLTSTLDQAKAVRNLKAASAYLRSQGSEKIASLGWCFGGGQSLQLALSGEPLDATVIYYGQLVTDKSRLQSIKWPVLGIFGDKDTSIPTTTVFAFRDALSSLNIPNEVTVYPGVGHAFANPSGMNYAPNETRDAWEKTVKFLRENLSNAN